MPPIDGLPASVALREVTPGRPGPRPPQNSVDHGSMVRPPVPPRRMGRHERFEAEPLRVGQVMAILHHDLLPHHDEDLQNGSYYQAATQLGWPERSSRTCAACSAIPGSIR